MFAIWKRECSIL